MKSLSPLNRTGEERTKRCASCGKYPGTQRWVGEGGSLAFIHGAYEMWCEGCVLRAQIAHCEERVKALADLRKQLAKWNTTHA